MRALLRYCLPALLLAFSIQPVAHAASAKQIDAEVDATLEKFYKEVGSGKALVGKADGVLVFPSVIKAGIGVGGEYGEGALRIGGKSVDYYNTAAASIGLQLGAQSKSVILIFLDKKALESFRKSDGWKAGVDGSVALIKVGAGGALDTNNIKEPIVGFIFGQQGLMYNLTLEGSKFTKMDKAGLQ
jgi:lipid-binding SYLF domain-containing protein